jgi:pimeloyl-ACP methyl ester carboxylesterase
MRQLQIWKWTKRVFALVASFVVLAASFGAAYQAIASHLDAKAPPPGLRIEIGGHRLHLYCQGHGTPTIVIISGAGVWSVQWRTIQDAIAQDTRVCTYDRDGYGWSDLGPSGPTAQYAAEELHALLEKAGEAGPYLLVGESYGGYVTRLFVDRYRSNVAAVALIESAHERQWDEIPVIKTLTLQGQQQLKIARWLSYFGFFRFWPLDRGEDLPPDVRRALIATQARTETFVAFGNEVSGVFTSARQAAGTHSLGDLPLVVVSARHSLDKFVPADERKNNGPINETWMSMQNELARLSSNSVHMISENGTHGIAREQPGFVISAIRRALQLSVVAGDAHKDNEQVGRLH